MISHALLYNGILAFLLLLTISCSAGDPITTDATNRYPIQDYENNHYLWNYSLVYVNPRDSEFEVIPVRQVASHWNILGFLEQGPCTDCLKITHIEQSGNGTLLVDIEITHPFDNANLIGFDVRGIAMFSGSHDYPASGLNMSDRWLGDGELVNADGYTTLYNFTTSGSGPGGLEGYIEGKMATATPPDALLNGYKRFSSTGSENTRNAFYSGDEITVTYEIDMPDGAFIFGYAVDASWAPAINKPVQDPMTDFGPNANCPEAWKMVVTSTYSGDGLNAGGGSATLMIDVYDWQGKDDMHPVLVECPDLFDGEVEGAWVSDGDGYSRYEAEVENTKLATAGYYRVLVSKETQENNPGDKPWLDLTAYQVFNIRVGWQPDYPTEVPSSWLSFSPHKISVDGDILGVAAGSNGAILFDITDPENPFGVGRINTTWNVSGVAVSGDIAVVASCWDYPHSKLDVVDIDPPESPHIVKTINVWGGISNLVASGSAVCYRWWQQSLHEFVVVDIVPPSLAYIVTGISQGWGTWGEHSAADGYACVPVTNGFRVMDINPPETAHAYSTVLTEINWDSAVSDGYAYLLGPDSKMLIADIDPPVSTYFVDIVDMPVSQEEMLVDDGYLYAYNESQFHILDVIPPESTHLVNSIDLTGEDSKSIAVSGGYAYISDGVLGIQIFDVDPPESANLVHIMETLSDANGVALDGGYAYLAAEDGLQIVDVEVPESTSIVRLVDTTEAAMKVAVSGPYAYVADGETGLLIFDIAPPELAYIFKTIDTPGYAWGVAVKDSYAYVADGDSGLQIIDVFPPNSAAIVNTVITPGPAYDVALMGDNAYVATNQGLQIVDINPPESAYILNGVHTIGSARGVAVSGNYAYLTHQDTSDAGLQIININPPELAHIVETVNTYGWARGASVSGGFAYVAADPGFLIYDVDPPESTCLVESFCTPSAVVDIVVLDNYAYLAGGSYGLKIIKLW